MKILLVSPQPFFRTRGTPINIRNYGDGVGPGGARSGFAVVIRSHQVVAYSRGADSSTLAAGVEARM